MSNADLEKLTINLGYVDLGRIDLLVKEGFFNNRSDFIRSAIRAQLQAHDKTVEKTIDRHEMDMGMRVLTREFLESMASVNEVLHLRVVGLVRISSDVDAELALKSIGSISILGTLQASSAVKSALSDRIN